MTATRDDLITQLRRTNADLAQRLDACTAELSENKERYALVSQAVGEGVYDWDIERNALWVSPPLIEIFGLDGPRLSAADWNARVHPDDLEDYRSALRNCFKGAAARLACEYRIRVTRGEYRWVEDHGLPVRGAGGRVVRLVGAVGDITERKETERALRASEERHALAMQAINEAVFEWDIRTGNVYFARLHQILGLAPEELRTGADWVGRIHPDDLPVYRPLNDFIAETMAILEANPDVNEVLLHDIPLCLCYHSGVNIERTFLFAFPEILLGLTDLFATVSGLAIVVLYTAQNTGNPDIQA